MNSFTSRPIRRLNQMRAQRASVSMQASIVTMNAYQFPELADISQTGAKLVGSPLPPKGTTALLKAGPLEVLCRVVWVRDEACGIRFDETVPPDVLRQIQRAGGAALETLSPAARHSQEG